MALFCFFAVLPDDVSSSRDIVDSGVGPAPLSFLDSQSIAMLLVSVCLILLFHFILLLFILFYLVVVLLFLLCVFIRCVSHPLPLPLFSCLGCIPLLIELPFLRSLLMRMFFLPYAY